MVERSPEQQTKVKACNTPEELLAPAKKEGYKLSDEQLQEPGHLQTPAFQKAQKPVTTPDSVHSEGPYCTKCGLVTGFDANTAMHTEAKFLMPITPGSKRSETAPKR